MQYQKQVTEKIKAIPAAKLSAKIKATVTGIVIAGLGVFGGVKFGWPWYIVVPMIFVGGHIASRELVEGAVKFVVATTKDLLAAVKNGKTGK